MCTYSAGCLVISPSSGHGGTAANNIPYSIALLNAQRRRVPALSPEKQPPQIRHLAADNRKQFRVRALGRRKGLRERADQVAHGLIYRAIFFRRWDLERRF